MLGPVFTYPLVEPPYKKTGRAMRHEDLRSRDQGSKPIKVIYRGVMLALTLEQVDRYEAVGRPFGKSIEGMLLWMKCGNADALA